MNANLDHLLAMRHSPVRNYAIPGLTSWLITEPTDKGCVRMFECERTHVEPITPHSHRFDFTAFVLQGQVTNRIWREDEADGDLYSVGLLPKKGAGPGHYMNAVGQKLRKFSFTDCAYGTGDSYMMRSHEIHSIYFTRGTIVLMIEGPDVDEKSYILEPIVDGQRIPLFRVEPWMFKKG